MTQAMKRLYYIRREDFFEAQSKGQIPDGCLHEFGSIWCSVVFDDNEKKNYSFAISEV